MKNILSIAFILNCAGGIFAQKIVLDAGHGWGAPLNGGGCENPDTRLPIEMSASFDVAIQTKAKIESSCSNWQVYLTRTSNDCNSWVYRGTRAVMANDWGADVFLSLHTNASTNSGNLGGTASGTETFWCESNPQPNADLQYFGQAVQANVVSSTGRNNRRAVDDIGYYGSHLTVLIQTTMVSALNEMGFGDNTNDYAKLSSSTGQDQYATAFFNAINTYFNNNCAGAQNIVGTMQNPIDVTCGSSYVGTTANGQSNFNVYTACGTQNEYGKEKVHKLVLTQNSDVQISLTGLAIDLDVHLLNGTSISNCIARNDNTITQTNLPAGTYYIVVDGFGTAGNAAAGSYALNVSCTPLSTSILESTAALIEIFPNPSENQIVNIKNTSNFAYVYDIKNTVGQNIVQYKTIEANSTINLATFAQGMYYIYFKNSETGESFVKKIQIL